jgi:hypothetical protein
VYAVNSINTAEQTWRGLVDITLLVAVSNARVDEWLRDSKEGDDSIFNANNLQENSSHPLWHALLLKVENRIEVDTDSVELWIRAGRGLPNAKYKITDVPFADASRETLFVIRWRFPATFTTPYKLSAFPIDFQVPHFDIMTTREDVVFADVDELTQFFQKYSTRKGTPCPCEQPSCAHVDRFMTPWAASPAASEWSRINDSEFAKQMMEPAHVYCEETVNHRQQPNTHRRFAFRIFRRSQDAVINIVWPMLCCTALGLFTSLGKLGSDDEGDIGTASSFFLAAIGIRNLTAGVVPKSVVTVLELFCLTQITLSVCAMLMCVSMVAKVLSYFPLFGTLLEASIWGLFILSLATFLPVLYFRHKLPKCIRDYLFGDHGKPCSYGCDVPVALTSQQGWCDSPYCPRVKRTAAANK